MALLAASRETNIAKSLTAYLAAQLVTGAGLTVVFPGQPVPSRYPVRWVEFTYQPLAPAQYFPTTTNGRGHLAQWLVNGNCMEEVSSRIDGTGDATMYSLLGLCLSVRNALLVSQRIAIRDYDTGGNPQVGTMRIQQQSGRQVTDRNPLGVAVWNVSAIGLYQEEFTV